MRNAFRSQTCYTTQAFAEAPGEAMFRDLEVNLEESFTTSTPTIPPSVEATWRVKRASRDSEKFRRRLLLPFLFASAGP